MNYKYSLVLMTLVSCLFAPLAFSQDGKAIVISSKQQQSMGIRVASLTGAIKQQSNSLPGEIVIPIGQERIVSVAHSGLVDVLLVAAGAEVKAGQVLGHITSDEMLGTQRNFLQAATQQQLAKKTFDRDAELYKDGIIAERRYLASQSSLVEANALLSQLKQSLKLGGMSSADVSKLARTGQYINGLNFTSPIDGHVLEQMVTLGQRVDSASPLFRIGRLSPLWLEVKVPIELAHTVKKDMIIRIPKYQVEGKVTTIIRSIYSHDQTMKVRAEITTNTDKLIPGQLVEAEFVYELTKSDGEQMAYFLVPKNGLVRQGGEAYIFVQTAKGFYPTKVRAISEQNGNVLVTGSAADTLTGKEQVAVEGAIAIKAAWLALSESE